MLKDIFNVSEVDGLVIAKLLLAAVGGWFVVNEFIRYKARLKGFHGPRGLPIFGNILQLQHDAPEKYREWSEEYGPVYQVMLGNIPVIVVNNAEWASKVFIHNSHATISRPMFYTFHKLVSSTAGFTIGSSPYNESLKKRRKLAAGALNKPSVQTYVPLFDREVVEFIREAYKGGEEGFNPAPLASRLSLNLGLTLNWGTRLELDDPMFKEMIEVEEKISFTRSVTGNWQDYIPIMRLFAFKQNQEAKDIKRRRDVYLHKLNHDLEEKIANKTHKSCIQANVMTDPEAKLNAAELMSISLTMITGGLDTVTTLVQWALPLLAMRPDIQEKAYKAIRELHSEVLPDANEDQTCLYVRALVKELLRMYPPVRLALPKCAEEDFYIDGKFVPKGTVLFLNAWACNMDPKQYKNPREFDPERFVNDIHMPQYAYGYGTRMCTGYMLANRELYVLFMRLISAFKLEPVDNLDIDPITGTKNHSALVQQPHPYKIKFKPRDKDGLEKALREFVPGTAEVRT